MTVVESPKGRASHNLGNRGAIPTFPPPGYCYIFFQNLSRKESSSPPAPSLFRLILRLEKTPPVRHDAAWAFQGQRTPVRRSYCSSPTFGTCSAGGPSPAFRGSR